MKSLYVRLADRLKRGEKVALAVIVDARGSAPQKAGAAALFSARKLVDGTVGGGALEAAVRRSASRALKAGDPLVFQRALKGKGPGGRRTGLRGRGQDPHRSPPRKAPERFRGPRPIAGERTAGRPGDDDRDAAGRTDLRQARLDRIVVAFPIGPGDRRGVRRRKTRPVRGPRPRLGGGGTAVHRAGLSALSPGHRRSGTRGPGDRPARELPRIRGHGHR